MTDSVRAVQFALRASGVKVSADGIFGPITAKAINESSSRSVRALAAEYPSLARRPQSGANIFFSNEEVNNAIDKVVSLVGTAVREYLELMVRLENFVVSGGYETSVVGTYRGLAQFSEASYNDVISRGRYKLPSYNEGIRSAEASLLAAASYWEINKRAFLLDAKRGGWRPAFIPNIAYLYHQQGAGGGNFFLKTGNLMWPKQSAASISVMLEGRNRIV